MRSILGVALTFFLHAPGAFAIGGQFGLEFAIDAPWRLEPVPTADGRYVYGPIPINVAFHDTIFESARSDVSSFTSLHPIHVGRLREIRVIEWTQDQPHPRHPVTVVPAGQLREIHRKKLVSTKTREPDHEICRPSPSQSCSAALEIENTHEWHGVFWYTPRAPVTPGRNVHLEVIVVTEYANGIQKNEWRNYLVVHAGEKPLPRFGDDWLYGDFHYHAQMTDNEGESSYSYRNIARALGAMGMDFVFATDHASNSEQRDGAIDGKYCADRRGGKCKEARDFTAPRYLAAKSLLYGPDGINADIAREGETGGLARLRSANVLPQVYLGEEVDTIPEITREEYAQGVVHYGDGLQYPWPDSSDCIRKNGIEACKKKYSYPQPNSYFLLDQQGIPVEEKIDQEIKNDVAASVVKFFVPKEYETRPDLSRQHLVYFPMSSALNADGWIGSDTREFGGGGKPPSTILSEIQHGGVAFLAHPLTDSKPGSEAGPDIVPYSDLELTAAWSTPGILGLEFWNENDQYRSGPDRRTPTVMFVGRLEEDPRTTRYSFPWPFQGHQTANFPWTWQRPAPRHIERELYHGAFTWDRYLRKGLDPKQTAALGWLPKGEPRKWFMAGGSDSHGDFNFRRYGRPGLDRWTDVPVGDTAIGNPRNLVSVASAAGVQPVFADGKPTDSGPRRYTNRQVIGSLQAGRFSVTDGPAIRIAIDTNLNGVIDEGDVPMGGTFNFYPGDRVPLLVEWLSTPEFGPIARIDVYVGNQRMTFAPKGHGPEIPREGGRNGDYGNYQPDPAGVLQVHAPSALTGAPLPGDMGYHGVARINLGPAQFALAVADQSLSYVRAYAVTIAAYQGSDMGLCPRSGTAGNRCGSRRAYSNPIWARYNLTCPTKPLVGGALEAAGLGRLLPTFVDANRNRLPDACDGSLKDACPGTRTKPQFDTGKLGERLGATDEHAKGPGTPQPARPIPASSCQSVAAL